MVTANIKVSLHGHSYATTFETDGPEYVIADEAYRIAILFAAGRAMAEYGHALSGHDFGIYLEDMEYSYEIAAGEV